MISGLIEKVFSENKPHSKLTLIRDSAADAFTWIQTLHEKIALMRKILRMLDKRTRRRGTRAGARVKYIKKVSARYISKAQKRRPRRNRAAERNA